MKDLKKLIVISLAVLCPVLSHAQGYVDNALNYGSTSYWGTARTRSMGGVGYSFGGDIGTIHMNPAGLGFYNRNDFSITPVVDAMSNESTYLGNGSEESLTRFNIGSLGMALNSGDLGNGWHSGTFGFSVDRINNFNRNQFYVGSNTSDSFVEYVLDEVPFREDNYLVDLAFDVFILQTVTDINGNQVDTTFIAQPEPEFPVAQAEYTESRGGQYKYSFSYGANYEDRLYLGLGIGVHSIDYEVLKSYVEVPTETELGQLSLVEFLDVRGSGIDFTFGAIFRPVETVTLGLRAKTPTWYSIEETFETTLTADFVAPAEESFDQTYVFNPYQYNLRTPAEVGAGITYFFNNMGLISVDVDYKNYSTIKLSGDGPDEFSFENEEIELIAKDVINIRAGGEVRLDPFRLRAGYARYGDPTAGVDDLDRSRSEISGGVGYRGESFYLDLALTRSQYNSATSPYPLLPGDGDKFAIFDNKRVTASLTAGFIF